ncbi:hypothetical protein ACFLT8_01215 [Chloroflexota bacterium]
MAIIIRWLASKFKVSQKHERRRQITQAQTRFPELSSAILEYFFDNFGYTMPLSLLAKIQRICEEIKPKLVVEFGSGLSTMVLCDTLFKSRGFLITIDESMKWLENTYNIINHKDRILFTCIPDINKNYYATLSKYISLKSEPDLIIIDGPSGGNRFSESALKLYNELLSQKSVCVIDDTDREENQLGANKLATKFSLHKIDYGDPIYVNHQYSILFPQHFDYNIHNVNAHLEENR